MPSADPGLLAQALRTAGRFLLRVPWPLALLLVAAWALLIWDLSSHAIPSPESPSFFWKLASNLAHAPLFGILTLWLAGLFLRRADAGEGDAGEGGTGAGGTCWPRTLDARYAWVFLGTVGYGILDEWHQSRIPGRDSSALDVLTDATSATVVLWIVHTLGHSDLKASRLRARLGLGALLCLLSATLATLST